MTIETDLQNAVTALNNAHTSFQTALTTVNAGVADVTTKANNAATSATNAANSATTATTKANEASASATSAANSATTATTKANEASASAMSAANSATTATTKAAEALASANNAAALNEAQLGSYTVGLSSSASGSVIANNNIYYWPGSLKNYDQYLTTFKIGLSARATITVVVAFVEPGGGLTLISSINIPMSVIGVNTASNLNIFVPAGCVVGSSAPGGYFDTTSVEMWNTSALPTNNTSKVVSNGTNVKSQFTLVGTTLNGANNGLPTAQKVGSTQVVGWSEPIVNTGSALPANYTYFPNTAVKENGYITQLKIGMASSGSVKIIVADITGNTLSNVALYSYDLPSGVNTVITNIPVSAGKYIGVCPVGSVFQNNGNNAGISGWHYVGIPSNGNILTSSSSHRFEWQLTIKSGLTGDVQLLQNSAGGTGTGLNLLEQADPTGVADATQLFTNARAAHPAPYVRAGVFAVTSITNKGEGFWGPNAAAVNVNGVRLALPVRPITGGLWHRFRARLVHSIFNNSPLIFVGDSISHWAYATSGENHFINQITRWANLGISKDEPLMTALRPSSTYLPSFYGVTTSGSVSTGTNGPLAESLILAPGASLSFSGEYEQVDVFYTQSSTAGTLAFSYNGNAAYKTVNCSGSSSLDVFSGPSATSQASSGNYTITNTHGSNSVEITGLVRLGIITGTVPRLHVMRAAHGSYQFTNFNSAAVTSILKQATYAGGNAANATVVIALGTNDSVGSGLNYATIKSRAETLVNLFTTGGVLSRNIYAAPVWRWSYYGATSYESADAALRDAYLGLGVNIIPTDGIDFIAQGLASDGHPNDNGNVALFNMISNTVADV